MKPIQTSRTIERIPIAQPTQYRDGVWTQSTYKGYDGWQQQYIGSSELEDPFPIARSFRLWQVEVANKLSEYYRTWWIPYQLNESEWLRELYTPGSWLNLQIAAMEAWYSVYELVKLEYYDISVPIDDIGITWKTADFSMIFYNDPIVIREKIIRKLHDKNQYRTITTTRPGYIETLQASNEADPLTIKIDITGTVKGERKYYDPFPYISREEIQDDFYDEFMVR